MTNLVPERRVDKNGVLTTKHVRADTTSAAQRSPMPPPTFENKTVLPTSNQKTKRWRVNKRKWDCDEELAYLIHSKFDAQQTYSCSDAESYDVLSVVAPETVFPLLSIGIRSSAEATDFLSKNGLSRLQDDFTTMASEALYRGYDSSKFIEFATAYKGHTRRGTFIDAVEVHFDSDLQAADKEDSYSARNRALEDMVIEGDVRLSDIRELGTKFIKEHSAVQRDMYRHLMLLNEGTTALKSATEIKQVILGAEKETYNIVPALDMSSAYGAELPKDATGSRIMHAWQLALKLRDTGRSTKENKSILQYSLAIEHNNKFDEITALYEAGVSIDDAALGMKNNLTVEQTIAMSRKTVTPSLASGVL